MSHVYAFEGGQYRADEYMTTDEGVYTDEHNLDLDFDDVSGAAMPRLTLTFTGSEPDTLRRVWESA